MKNNVSSTNSNQQTHGYNTGTRGTVITKIDHKIADFSGRDRKEGSISSTTNQTNTTRHGKTFVQTGSTGRSRSMRIGSRYYSLKRTTSKSGEESSRGNSRCDRATVTTTGSTTRTAVLAYGQGRSTNTVTGNGHQTRLTSASNHAADWNSKSFVSGCVQNLVTARRARKGNRSIHNGIHSITTTATRHIRNRSCSFFLPRPSGSRSRTCLTTGLYSTFRYASE